MAEASERKPDLRTRARDLIKSGGLGGTSITTRLVLGFGLLSLISLVIGGFAYVTQTRTVDRFLSSEALSQQAIVATEADAAMARIQVAVMRYQSGGAEEDLAKVRKEIAILRKSMDALLAADGENERITEATAQIAEYEEGLEILVELSADVSKLLNDELEPVKQGLQKDLKTIADTYETYLDYDSLAVAKEALEQLLAANSLLSRYLLTNDPADREGINEAIATIEANLIKLSANIFIPEVGDAMKTAQPRLAALQSVIARLTDLISGREMIRKDVLEDVGSDIAEKFHVLHSEAVAEQAALIEAVHESTRADSLTLAAKLVASLIIAVIIATVVSLSISRPLRRVTNAMRRIADYELDAEIDGLDRRDEIGEIARALQVFRQNAAERRDLREAREAEQQRERARADAIGRTIDGFEQKVAGIIADFADAADGLRNNAEAMTSSAGEANKQSAAVAEAAQLASGNVAAVAQEAEEISGSILEFGRQISRTNEIVADAVSKSGAANEDVRYLHGAADKIGDVITMIQDIAEQTNLLALNATIEAARSGEAGKGFAVVANEVKSLAGQTAEATQQIADQIADIQSATQRAVKAIEEIVNTVQQVDDIASSISQSVEQQTESTQSISRSVKDAAAGTDSVSSNIAVVSQVASETGDAAEGVSEASRTLNSRSQELRAAIDNFLETVRAA